MMAVTMDDAAWTVGFGLPLTQGVCGCAHGAEGAWERPLLPATWLQPHSMAGGHGKGSAASARRGVWGLVLC